MVAGASECLSASLAGTATGEGAVYDLSEPERAALALLCVSAQVLCVEGAEGRMMGRGRVVMQRALNPPTVVRFHTPQPFRRAA